MNLKNSQTSNKSKNLLNLKYLKIMSPCSNKCLIDQLLEWEAWNKSTINLKITIKHLSMKETIWQKELLLDSVSLLQDPILKKSLRIIKWTLLKYLILNFPLQKRMIKNSFQHKNLLILWLESLKTIIKHTKSSKNKHSHQKKLKN